MNGVAAEIAIKIGVLLQHDCVHAGAGEEVTAHHSGRSAADDRATDPNLRQRAHHEIDL